MANTTTITNDVRNEIKAKLVDMERNMAWLANKTGIPYGTIYAMIEQKDFNINQVRMKLINTALGTKYVVKSTKK